MAKQKKKQTGTTNSKNKILENHGNWLLVDISTNKHKNATMAIDADVFNSYIGGRIFAWAGSKEKYIYARHRIHGSNRLFHRSIIDHKFGMEIDHCIHGSMNYIDNRRSNLREVTKSQNNCNRGVYSNNTSGIPGVSWHKRKCKWSSQIQINGKYMHLGSFANIDFAIGARLQAEREYFGEFAFKEAK